jgi:hypothetical protein
MQETLFKNYNAVIPGGSCYSVCAGGHICGGGYGFLSRLYGLTVDWLYGIEIVIVDKNKNTKIVKAYKDSKKKKYRDLWWGHTGGGGGNFGIITKYFFKTLPKPPENVYLGTLNIPWTDSKGVLIPFEKFKNILDKYGQFFSYVNKNNKYNDLFPQLIIAYISGGGAFYVNCQSIYKESMDAFFTYVFGEEYTPDIIQLPWLYATQTLNGSGSNYRFKNKSAYMNKPFPLRQIEVLYNWYSGTKTPDYNIGAGNIVIIDGYGGQINKVPVKETAVSARDSILKLQYIVTWSDKNDDDENLNWIRELYTELYGEDGPYNTIDGLAGCYINYPDRDLKNWEFLYYQNNYKRLQCVKTKWDPNNFFNHAQSIKIKNSI